MYDLVIASALQEGWIELDIEPLLGNEKLFFLRGCYGNLADLSESPRKYY